MKRLLFIVAMLPALSFAQAPRDVNPDWVIVATNRVAEDYIRFAYDSGLTNYVLNGTISVDPMLPFHVRWPWSIGGRPTNAVQTDYSANPTNSVTWQRDRLSNMGARGGTWTDNERAIGLAVCDLLNGRVSNLVVAINKRAGFTGTNKITAAEVGGFVTPSEASAIAKGYLP